MRVLSISLFSQMPHHVATELEILQRHLDEHDQISVLGCHGFLPACVHKVEDNPLRCRECLTSRSNGLRLLDAAPTQFSLDAFYTDADREKESLLQLRFDSISEIHDYEVEGFDIGYAALSSAVFIFRDGHLESPESQDLFSRMIVTAYRTFCAVREFLRQHPDFDRVYIFNGRFASCRGAYRAAKQAGLHVILHERGSDNSKYMLYEHELPHHLETMRARIQARWKTATEEDIQAARLFYDQRRARVEKYWHSHTKAQQKGRLPASWDESRRNIVVFTSSDDEYIAIGKEWITPGFESQSHAIVNLCKSLHEVDEDVMLYVRIHPFLKGIDNQDTRMLNALSGERVEVIRSDSEVCTYTLMDQCEKVVTFGSTIGIEATYWGKPSVLAGMHFFRTLGGNYIANSDQELLELTLATLEPKPQESALVFGVFMMHFGQPFKYYEAKNFETGSFRGTPLRTAMAYSPFGMLLPTLTRTVGANASMGRAVERIGHALLYVPFQFVYDLLAPVRAVLKGRN